MPFVRYSNTLRAQQGYLTKFPKDMISWFAPLAVAARLATETAPTPANPAPTAKQHAVRSVVGVAYRPADEAASVSTRNPMSIDPAIVERGTRGHAHAQNVIAEAAALSGFSP